VIPLLAIVGGAGVVWQYPAIWTFLMELPIIRIAFANKSIKVAAVFSTTIDESWNKAIHAALSKLSDSKTISYVYNASLSPAQMEDKVRQYCTDKYDMIWGDAFGNEQALRRIASEYPEIAFVFGSGLGPTDPNFSVFDNWIHEPAYIAGMIAACLSKSGRIGIVGGRPIPEVVRLVEAFRQGAKDMDTQARVEVRFINSWLDRQAAAKAAEELVTSGIDCVYAERDGVIEDCAKLSVPLIGNVIAEGPDSDCTVTSVVWNMLPTVEHAVEQRKKGTYSAEDYGNWSRLYKSGSLLSPFPPQNKWWKDISLAEQKKIQERYDEIISGRFRVPVIEELRSVSEEQ
jgi:basic membrane lipoprotein Med (substrate-binding protein (PBP1-ABC) superfamily)